MLIKQTHFPIGSKGPNWPMIIVITAIVIGAGFVIYQAAQDPIILKNKNQNHEQ